MSKDGREDQFHERKTRTRSPEETGGLAQPDRGQEGPFLGGAGFEAEGLGGGAVQERRPESSHPRMGLTPQTRTLHPV